MPSTPTRQFHRLRVTLMDSDPEIWRTFDIDAALTLRDLHDALQIIVGWRESHLHQFLDQDPWERRLDRSGDAPEPRLWTEPDPYGDELENAESDDGITIAEAFATGGPLYYEYDFGDGWLHRIDLIERGPMDADEPTVTLVRGERRAPFEDAGGMHGYIDKLAILADPQHPEHAFIANWVNDTVGPWSPSDPEFFDPDAVQGALDLRFRSADEEASDDSGFTGADRDATGLTDASPLLALSSRLPVPLRAELRAHLFRTNALSTALPDAATRERMTAPFRWLIDAVGLDGLMLTKAGWMPPAAVLDGMTRLGWRESWIGEANREDITPPMRNLRAAAQRMGIVRLSKGRLLLGADAKKAVGEPDRLWRLAASRMLRGLTDAERDASTLLLLALADGTATGVGYRMEAATASAIGFGLDCLGWTMSDGRTVGAGDIARLTSRLEIVLGIAGAYQSGRGATSGDVTSEGRAFAREALR